MAEDFLVRIVYANVYCCLVNWYKKNLIQIFKATFSKKMLCKILQKVFLGQRKEI